MSFTDTSPASTPSSVRFRCFFAIPLPGRCRQGADPPYPDPKGTRRHRFPRLQAIALSQSRTSLERKRFQLRRAIWNSTFAATRRAIFQLTAWHRKLLYQTTGLWPGLPTGRVNNSAMSLSGSKEFRFNGRYTVQVRGDFLNAFNQHSFSTPDMNPYDGANLGTISTLRSQPRRIALTAKFTF